MPDTLKTNGNVAGNLRKAPLFRCLKVSIPCTGLVGLLAGCQVVAWLTMGALAAVGLAGYAVYEAGEVSVIGVGEAAVATGSAISSGAKSVTLVFADGDLKTQCAGDVKTVWTAANRAFKNAGFQGVQGSFDALAGDLAATSGDGAVHLKLKCIDAQTTEMRIRVGERGDLKPSKFIHSLILKELSASSVPGSAKEVTP